MTEAEEIQLAAEHAAWAAYEFGFNFRRIVTGYNGSGRVFYMNNHPYSGGPGRRRLENETIKQKLVGHGLRVLAEASYPNEDLMRAPDSASRIDDGTTCIIFSGGGDPFEAEERVKEVVSFFTGSVNSELSGEPFKGAVIGKLPE